MASKALITGVTGQDGSYLAELLLSRGYEVHGLIRRASTFNTQRIEHLYRDPHESGVRLFLHYGDLANSEQLTNIIYNLKPDEIYPLGAQAHVRVSFEMPEYTGDITGLGTTRLLEALRRSGIKARFYQAGSSEVYGGAPPRRDVRHAQDHDGAGGDQSRAAAEALPGQPGCEAGLGVCSGVRRRHVADAAAGRAPGLRARHGRNPLREGVPHRGVRVRRAGLAGARGDRSALLPPRGRGPAPSPRLESQAAAALVPPGALPGAGTDHGRCRSRGGRPEANRGGQESP